MSQRTIAVGVAVLLLVAWPRPAHAHGWIDFDEAYALKVGVPLGYSIDPGHISSTFSGLELNFGTGLDRETWFGLYTDAQWRLEAKQARWSIGPMFGWALFGLDGGYLVARGDGELRRGFAVRPFVTAGIIAGYYRLEALFDESEIAHDLGVVLEVPFLFDR
jgi:hypothetical protein